MASPRILCCCAALVVQVGVVGDASAQVDPEFDIGYGESIAITTGALTAAYLFSLAPVDTSDRWGAEILGPLDETVRDNFSPMSGIVSDGMLYTSMAVPLFIAFRDGFDDRAARRALIYAETMAINTLAVSSAKLVVKRPRPYTYNTDARVIEFAEGTGKKSHRSFYSGHSSSTFAAAVAGSYIYSLSSSNVKLRAWAWGLQLALASTTANLRVRAGAHFYSDIVIGALVGSAIGYAVPALQTIDRGLYSPSAIEYGAMAGGVVAGAFLANVLPFSDEPGGRARLFDLLRDAQLVPTATPDGAGLALTGRL